MTLSAAAERSFKLAADLDSRLVELRRCLRDAQDGAGSHAAARHAATSAAAAVDRLGALDPPIADLLPSTARQLRESAPPPPRSGSSAQQASALTEELWSSLSRLQKTLELPPPLVRAAKDSAGQLPQPPRLAAAPQIAAPEPEPEPEPDLEVEVPYVWPDTPEAEVCRSVAEASELLAPRVLCSLHALLPLTQQVGDWVLIYSVKQHGSSLDTMLRNCRNQGPSVVVVRDTCGNTFGGYVSTLWPSEPTGSWAGNGQCFLWAVDSQGAEPEVVKFSWTRRSSQFLWTSRDAIGLGGGGGTYGLWLDKSFASGTTGTCETFGNPALCEVAKAETQSRYSVANLEVWGIAE